jgi:signal transduction histidine kinase
MDLVATIREIAARLEDQLRESRSELTVRAPARLIGRWDRERLEAVVSNLITNAINYGEGQPIDIELEDLGPAARLRVIDRGIGISNADQQRIFMRFERAIPEQYRSGLGLGLWLAKRIVEAHGGTIEVQSRPGAGSTFTVELPKHDVRT